MSVHFTYQSREIPEFTMVPVSGEMFYTEVCRPITNRLKLPLMSEVFEFRESGTGDIVEFESELELIRAEAIRTLTGPDLSRVLRPISAFLSKLEDLKKQHDIMFGLG